MINRIKSSKRLLSVIVVVSAVTFLVAGGALLFSIYQSPTPAIVFVPPVALDQLAAQYPEIASILQDPALGSAYKEFMLAYQQGGIAAAENLARERGLLNKRRELQITLLVDHADNVAAVATELQKMGITIVGAYDELIEIAIPLALIEQIARAENPGKIFSQLTALKHVLKIRMPTPNQGGAIEMWSEAVATTGAEQWHKAGFTGRGVKIGILDLGFDEYKPLLGKTLPARVTAKSFVAGEEPDSTDENHGTLCAQVAYAMAPGAEFYFAYYSGEASQRAAVAWLIDQGVQIISHSAGTMGDPTDGTGSRARFVDSIAVKGVVWVNSAGNYGEGHYRAIVSGASANQWLSFPSGGQTLKLIVDPSASRSSLILQWDDWSGNASEDYDLFLYDGQGNLVARSEDRQASKAGDRPVEAIILRPPRQTNYFVKILAKRTVRNAILDLFVHNGNLDHSTPAYSLGSPADARGSLSVGAIFWRTNALEAYSSRGPTNDGRIKPDLVAPAGVKTAQGAFFGTSAAAPHVSGAAALVWGRFSRMTANEVKAYLVSNAIDMGTAGADSDSGGGRLHLPGDGSITPTVRVVAPTATAPRIAATVTALSPTRVAVVPQPTAPPTAQPTVVAIPRAPQPGLSSGAILVLGLLMCSGLVGSVGGLALLLFATRSAVPSPSAPPLSPRPNQPRAPIAPVINPPVSGSVWLTSPAGRIGPLARGTSMVGRSAQNTIHLDAPEISRQHATLTWDGARVTLVDLGSSNGTFVNGRRVIPRAPEILRPGDRVSFGGGVTWTVTW